MTDISTRHLFGPRNQFQVERDDFKGIKYGSETDAPFTSADVEEVKSVRHYYDGYERYTTVIEIEDLDLTLAHDTTAFGGINLGTFDQSIYVYRTGQIRNLSATYTGGADTTNLNFSLGNRVATGGALTGTGEGTVVTVAASGAAVAKVLTNRILAARTTSITAVDLSSATAAQRGLWFNGGGTSGDAIELAISQATLIFSWMRVGLPAKTTN
jgi:hypothetical protein